MKVRMCLAGVLLVAIAPLMVACKSLLGGAGTGSESKKEGAAASGNDVDVGFLLSMSYTEAQSISPQNLVFGEYRIAADEIKVLSKDGAGDAKRVRAKGHVFIEMDMREDLRALAQEALLEKDEVILRGKPLLKRGRSVVEGDDDMTVFDVQGTKLRVVGRHHLTTAENGVAPGWKDTWKEGPNPLLPTLSPEQVHRAVQGSPLLPEPPPTSMSAPTPAAPTPARAPSSSDQGHAPSTPEAAPPPPPPLPSTTDAPKPPPPAEGADAEKKST